MRYTPEPWEVDKNSPASVIALNGDCGMKRQWVATANGPINAHLIAAAPIGYKLAELIWDRGISNPEDCLLVAREFMAKANPGHPMLSSTMREQRKAKEKS